MSLLEMVVALFIFGLVASASIAMVQQQDLAFSAGAAQMDATQNYRFAAELLERNLRSAGNNVTGRQPTVVFAGESTLTINADYSTADANDMFAVYIDPGAPAEQTGSLPRSRQITIPGSSFRYPQTTFQEGSIPSPAETITFFFAPDSTTQRSDDYLLSRQVNDGDPEVVARQILRLGTEPFFAYQEEISGDTVVTRVDWVSPGALPLRHLATEHSSPADTGAVARIDNLRAVRVAFTSVAGSGADEQTAPVRRTIHMPNVGKAEVRTCGEEPVFNATVQAAQPDSAQRIEVTWNASFDEISGESDVIRYAIFRRSPPAMGWGEPFFSIPAGQSSYLFNDTEVAVDTNYQYAVAAQDCTPSLSRIKISNAVHVSP